MTTAPVLVMAVGNESRGDDALGPLLLRDLAAWLACGEIACEVETIEEFQLQVEHTLDLKDRSVVLFIDAGKHTHAPFTFAQAAPKRLDGHTTHAVAPESLLGIYAMVHAADPPPAFILCVAGSEFELGEPLSAQARQHLQQASAFARRLFEHPAPAAWQALAAGQSQ